MQTEISKFIHTIEFTDEMKQLQKDYEKIIKIGELFDKASDLIYDLFDTKPICENNETKSIFAKRRRLDSAKMIKQLEQMNDAIGNESWYISLKVQELVSFQKIGNIISIQKDIARTDHL